MMPNTTNATNPNGTRYFATYHAIFFMGFMIFLPIMFTFLVVPKEPAAASQAAGSIILGLKFMCAILAVAWGCMFFVPYVTIDDQCITYKASPIFSRKKIPLDEITGGHTTHSHFIIAYTPKGQTQPRELKIGLFGIPRGKEMATQLRNTIDALKHG